MLVEAIEECFASNAIRRPGDKPFYFTPVNGVIPTFLRVVDEKAEEQPTKDDKYAALSDEQIRRRLEEYCVKVPPLLERAGLIAMLTEAEGQEIKKDNPKKQSKRGGKK